MTISRVEKTVNETREELGKQLGYRFRDDELLERALTHRSFVNEQGCEERCTHNERLEFLGDAVVGVSVAHFLMLNLPQAREGRLTKTRAAVVSEAGLSEAARRLGLGSCLRLGKGEEQGGGREKPSILCDAFEALVGAIYLDSDYETAREVVLRQLEDLLRAALRGDLDHDFKTRLQERLAAAGLDPPLYPVVAEHGPDHEKVFEVVVRVGEREFPSAQGHSKKAAEQKAAERALDALALEE
ncbi:MAG: ribonuclease III [Deltaproteobacteria bacterium]|nr:ribonuclease III [Deltaproteobacteria bacterium]